MKKSIVEYRVIEIIDLIRNGGKLEDSLVELKSEWIAPDKAARQIAGLANAARGEDVLWIVGVDEKLGVVGCGANESEEWYAKVQSYFDGPSPTLWDLAIPHESRLVVALSFCSDQAPYVVRNPLFGTASGHSIALEVPWREGLRTRTATRRDLLQVLVPAMQIPDLEVLGCVLTFKRANRNDSDAKYAVTFTMDVYATVTEPLVIPFHKCAVELQLGDPHGIVPMTTVRIRPTQRPVPDIRSRSTESASATMESTPDEIVIHGPGKFTVRSDQVLESFQSNPVDVPAFVTLCPARFTTPLHLEVVMRRQPYQGGDLMEWKMK